MTVSIVSNSKADQSVLAARVKREQECYDEGLQRQTYDDVLSHCQSFWHDAALERFRDTVLAPGVENVLEIGSHGWAMVYEGTASAPRALTCINISETELENGRQKARACGYDIDFRLMDAHKLAFPDNSFDVVFGFGILHHLDYAAALDEIRRVLRPGGRMIFNEPLDMNPVGVLVRKLTPEARTPDEAPIRREHLRLFEERFELEFYPQQFLSVPAGILSRACIKSPKNFLMRTAFACDRSLARLPGLRLWFRKAVLTGAKSEPTGRKPSERPDWD
jgi:ubiquinone/menaquinone biosynthesis C-methylase UbiE